MWGSCLERIIRPPRLARHPHSAPVSMDRVRAFCSHLAMTLPLPGKSPAPVLLLFCALTLSCAEPPEPAALTRLTALLPEAEIVSPLTDLPPARTIADLGEIAREELWRESFEKQPSRFILEGDCTHPFDGERGSMVLACQLEGRAKVRVPIQPGRGYRVHLKGRQERLRGYDISVIEHAEATALRIFRFQDLPTAWTSHETWFYSSPLAHSIEINIEPQHAKGRLWLDEVIVERFDLTREQELRLLKGQAPRSGQDIGLGVAKRGRLLPVGDANDETSGLQTNYVIRDALLAPPPTDFHFQLPVPRSAELKLSYALAEQSLPDEVVRLRVLATEAGNAPRVLLEDTLSLGRNANSRTWQEREISLAEFGGRDVRLTLETRSIQGVGRAYPLWGNPEVSTPRRRGEPPNVILIAVDTLRADRLSCYGHTPGTSPAIDSLAQQGVRFDQAISSANWTAPSFFSLFTGRPAPDLSGILREAPEQTLAEHFQDAGYATAAIMYKPMLYDKGFDRGFDYFFNAPRYNVRATHNLAKALAWLRKNKTRRFFLLIHFNDPHQPFCQPAESVDDTLVKRLDEFGLQLPIMVYSRAATMIDPRYPTRHTDRRQPCSSCTETDKLTPAFKELASDLYDDAIRYTDDHIAKFLTYLKTEEIYDEAVIAFVSDHGETLWNRNEHYSHGTDNLHDELIHIPLIIKPTLDQENSTGRTVTQQVRLLDLMPTLLELAEISPPPTAGESLVPALKSQGKMTLRSRPAFSIGSKSKTLSLRHEGWKYIRYYPKSPAYTLRELLYDLSADPNEHTDVAHQQAPKLHKMRRMMDEQLLVHGSGRSVVVKVDPSSGHHIRLRWDRDAQLGPFPQPGLVVAGENGAVTWEYSVVTTGSQFLLTSFMTPDDASLEVVVQSPDQPEHRESIGPEAMEPYRRNMLTDLLSRSGIQVAVFTGRNAQTTPATALPPVDAQQEEALRALGYID